MTEILTMEWTDSKCLDLIEEYKNNSLLWDPSNQNYYKKPVKEDAWQEIGSKLGIAGPECKQKMVTILASWRREKMKIKKSYGTGKGTKDIYKSKWFAFEALNFLMDRDKPRQGLTTQETGSTEATDNQNPDVDIASEIPPPKKAKQDIKLKMLKEAFGILKESVNKPPPAINENERELQSFFNFIIEKMKKYSAHTKNTVQHEIFQIISRADQGYYDNPTLYGYYSQQNNPTQPINLQTNQYPNIPTTATTSVLSATIEQPSPSTSHDIMSLVASRICLNLIRMSMCESILNI